MHLNLQFLCNFNDQIDVENIEPESLKRVWQSEWHVQHLPELLKKWSAKAGRHC
ncbi:hypothetical protein DOY81_013286 [Sarcophaga bullata]|nr:hypothetical protein DOY81_013286 [Sarcophaga bullata]